jgi:VWFA-related protein
MRFAALLAFASLLSAQDPAPAQAPPVIKMTTRQVQASVVVRDKKGQPVADLKREDFVVLDQGKPQEIRYFATERSDKSEASAPPLALPAGMYSNRSVSAGPGHPAALPNALTVILLDGLNTRYSDRAQARDGLAKFLGALKPGDRVAIYTLTTQLRVLHDFTSDISELQKSLQPHKGKSQDSGSHAESDAMDRFLTESVSPMIVNFPQMRTPATLEALRGIAFQLAGIPGRKNLVWLSDGFPLNYGRRPNGTPGRNYENFSADEQRTIRALDDAGVAIYPVDARGLIGSFDMNPSTDPSRTAPRSRRAAANMDNQAQNYIADTKGELQQIADGTGGVAFMNSNDLGSAIRRAVEDSTVSYTIGYSPSHNQWDGEFREIKITVNRSGVEAHYRKGYYAVPDKPLDAQARSASLVAAADSPLPSTGLGLVGRIVPAADAASTRVAVRVVVDPAEVSFAQGADGNWKAQLDVFLTLRDSTGNRTGQVAQAYTMTLKPEQYAEARKSGMALDAKADAGPAKPVKARIVVRDAATGAVGSLDLPLGETSPKD